MTEIQCRCGAVWIELTAEPIAQFFCHCDDCQAVHGAAEGGLRVRSRSPAALASIARSSIPLRVYRRP